MDVLYLSHKNDLELRYKSSNHFTLNLHNVGRKIYHKLKKTVAVQDDDEEEVISFSNIQRKKITKGEIPTKSIQAFQLRKSFPETWIFGNMDDVG